MKKTLLILMLIASNVSADTTQFRTGDLITYVTDVLGFTLLDVTAATYDIIWLMLILAVGFIIKKWFL